MDYTLYVIRVVGMSCGGLRVVPVHVEAEAIKGKYHDYDTFIGAEAVEYLRIYLEIRRKELEDTSRECILRN